MLIDGDRLVKATTGEKSVSVHGLVRPRSGGPQHVAIGIVAKRIHLDFKESTGSGARIDSGLGSIVNELKALDHILKGNAHARQFGCRKRSHASFLSWPWG